MAEFRRMLLLVNAAAGLLSVSGAGITEKNVCPGDSVQAFENIDFDRCNALVSLHINGKRNTEIATWLWQNCTLNVTLIKEYKDRVFLDQTGTITIHNLHHFDQGKYVVFSKKDQLPSIKEVQINVMVASSKDCKPMIVRLGNRLFASLKDSDCGTPVATLYWKGDGGVSDTNGPMLKITPGTECRTYYACIQGPALQCAKRQMPPDNCSSFIIEGNTSRTMSSESSSTVGFIAGIVVLGILLSLAIVAIVILLLILKRRRRNLNGEHTAGLLNDGEKHFDDVNAEHDKILQLCDEDLDNLRSPSNDERQSLETRSDNLRSPSNDERQSLETRSDNLRSPSNDQQQSLETRSDSLRSPSNDQQQSLETRSDSDYELNEIGTNHQSGIDPDRIRELQELRDAAVCKICFANKTSVFFMPCNHVATCDECSTPLHTCPVCRATINERKRICFDSDE